MLAESAATLTLKGKWAVVVAGSYARREPCPGSDFDVVLIHGGGVRGREAESAARVLWYPFWDAGFSLGQATRTPKEALALADNDLDALTAMLDIRVVAGDQDFAFELRDKVRALAAKRRTRVIDALATAASARYERPGPVAEMVEPNVKEGAGGLRDLQALMWAGWTVSSLGGLTGLVEAGVLTPDDVDEIQRANAHLLDVRVALHRVTGGRSDQLTLQEQDAVAHLLECTDADAHAPWALRRGPRRRLDEPGGVVAPRVRQEGSERARRRSRPAGRAGGRAPGRSGDAAGRRGGDGHVDAADRGRRRRA